MFSFHLAQVDARVGAAALLRPGRADGLLHAEALATMRLGAPVISPDRLQLRRLAFFARWSDESALESFLSRDPFGQRLAPGWHVRMEFVRRWGEVAQLADLPIEASHLRMDDPVVAVTLARHKLPQLARFISWGRPVERQVRDDPATTIALAAFRPPHTFSTFSIWRTTREMTSMVFGRDEGDEAQRHARAMAERERRDFHREFTTMRFRPISEHGSWDGRSDYLPG